ncbi:hypothetical protein SLS55_010245 [Diplodia seriata]|uniref:FAD-binding PCMH-type domain-containing protein n=1 Tax=Diplodia seriata TaxID=420778 RepID=A0ABR3BY06_9PEZI
MGSSDLVSELRSALTDVEVVTPQSPNYRKSIERWSDASVKEAAIVVYPTTAAAVSTTIKLATANAMPLVVSGGQHSTSGDSSIANGLVIDLFKMRDVGVDAAARTITAGGGCTWKDVDEAGAAHGLATVGGTVNHTGIGGLTLGGGYGFLSGLYGLTVDNLVAVEMVLADGAIVTASETENPDLFWAARGAGASFGVATRFTYRAHEVPRGVFMGMLMFPPSCAAALVDAANRATCADSDGRTVVHAALMAAPPGGLPGLDAGETVMVGAVVFHCGPEAQAREVLAPLLGLGALVDTTAEMPYSAVNGVLAAAAPRGGRKSIKGASFPQPLATDKFERTLKEFRAFVKEVPAAGKSLVSFENMKTEKICEPAVGAMAMPHRSGRLQCAIMCAWEGEEHDEAVRMWGRRIAAVVNEPGKADEGRENFEYVNYDGNGSGPEIVYGPNYEQLSKLKAKYDPTNVFKKNVQIKPAA